MSRVSEIFERGKQLVRENRLLLSNISYLGLFQVLLLVLPLITYPYLIRVVGADLYGRVAYAQAVVAFVIIAVNFGLNILATKDISEHRNDPDMLNRIVSKVYAIKSILFLVSLLLYLVSIYSFGFFVENRVLFLLSFGYCLPEWLLPVWYFQGVEKMKYMTLVDSVAKVFFTVLIFFVVSLPEHFIRIPMVQTTGAMSGAAVGFVLLLGKEGRRFVSVSRREVVEYAREALPFFLSRVSVVTINQLTTILVGRLLGYVEVAWFDMARKVFNVLMIPSMTVTSAIYPRIAYSKSKRMARGSMIFQALMGVVIYAGLYVSTPLIIKVLGGEEMLPALSAVRFYGLMVVLCHLTWSVGTAVMVPMGLASEFNRSVLYSLVVYLLINAVVVLCGLSSLNAFIAVALITEMFLLCYRFFHCHKHKILA